MNILVTGGAGFIGSALVRYLIQYTEATVINLDKLTYAGNLESLSLIAPSPRHHFEQLDICDQAALQQVFCNYQPDAVMHLAAESHVDRSIDGPAAFIDSNIVGTFHLLEASRHYIAEGSKSHFRFLHVSTDEVFGSLGPEGYFTEQSPYDPRSPYSASKAASDHLVRAYFHTYQLPIIITNCSNNYGPYQFPEKLIPLVIQKALAGESIPVYGKGDNIRDWLYVDDHVRALYTALLNGQPGETYTIGGHNEKQNLEVVKSICTLLNELKPQPSIPDYSQLITFVTDRPGHDARYAIDASKIQLELGWQPQESFETGIRKTVQWYLDNQAWCERVLDGSYRLERIGISNT